MTVLSFPRHPLVAAALADASVWCAGRLIEHRPALRHAAAVAAEVVRHTPDASAQVVAAALLHDAPEFAPVDLDLPTYLTVNYGAQVAKLVPATLSADLAASLDQVDAAVAAFRARP